MRLDHSAPASDGLLADLRSDRGMEWVPEDAWLSKVEIDASAPELRFDLAVDATGESQPSRLMAGLDVPGGIDPTLAANARWLAGIGFVVVGVGGIELLIRYRPRGRAGMSPA